MEVLVIRIYVNGMNKKINKRFKNYDEAKKYYGDDVFLTYKEVKTNKIKRYGKRLFKIFGK